MESNISRDHIALEAMKCMMMTANAGELYGTGLSHCFSRPKKLVLQTTTIKDRLNQLTK